VSRWAPWTSNPVGGSIGCLRWVRFPHASAIDLPLSSRDSILSAAVFCIRTPHLAEIKLFTAVRIKTSYKKSIEPVVKPIYNQIAHSLKYGTIKKL